MTVVPTGIDQTPSSFNKAVGVFLLYGDLVLLCRRCLEYKGIPTTYPGHWSPFAGSVEEGESPLACAVRELREESGMTAHPLSLTYFTELHREEGGLILYALELQKLFHPTLDLEHTEYGYFKIESLHASPFPTCPHVVAALQDFDRNRRRAGW